MAETARHALNDDDFTEIPIDSYYGAAPALAEAPDDRQGVVDESPALTPVDPVFNSSEVEGVDVESFPQFKDMRKMLPSKRLGLQMSIGKIATQLPKELQEGGSVTLDTMKPEDFDALTNMVAAIEQAVIGQAKTPAAMEEWLCAQENSLDAVMWAFDQLTAKLGNL